MRNLKIAITQEFFTAFASIPRAQQKKVNHFVSKFRNNPLASGINYEKINDAANDQYRSVRIDQDYRGIVLKPDSGDVYLLLWVAKHDDAYDWARRHRCAVNNQTGCLQLYETLHEAPVEDVSPAASEAGQAPALLQFRSRELLRLGVPDEWLGPVQALTSLAQLEALKNKLPVEAFEALCFLADGCSLVEVMAEYAQPDSVSVEATDLATALEHPQSQRRFHVVKGELELQQMLEAPLDQWRVFLHPSQQYLVERNWNGPVRVLGGAGTGKTVVAMHRARWLVANVLQPGERVLFTTFTRNLAVDIEANLRKICTAEQMKQIEVTNIDAWVKRFLKRENQPNQIVYPGDAAFEQCWKRALQLIDSSLGLPESFYADEWERVVLPMRIMTRAHYFKASRVGRGVPLTRKQRALIWPVFEELRFQLHQQGLLTGSDAVYSVLDILLANHATRPYRAVVVDEAQDLGAEFMQLVRALAQEGENDLMIVGDGHQRIYGRRSSLRSCGIKIVGRGRKLRINYRTTDQIRRWAVEVLEGVDFDDLDEGNDSVTGYRSLVDGIAPVLKGFDSEEDEALWVEEQIKRLVSSGYAYADICLVGRTAGQLQKVKTRLEQAGVEYRSLSRNAADNRQQAGVRLANMHRIKGLEFKVVFIVGANKGKLPLEQAISSTSDPVEKKAKEAIERALLHVAATRAIRELYVSWVGNPSVYLKRTGA